MKKIIVVGSVFAFLPGIAFAANIADVKELINYIIEILNMTVPLIFAIAMVSFVWGVLKYVVANDVKSKAEGRPFVIYGIIGLAVMLSIWGLAYFVKNSFFESAPTTPSGLPSTGTSGGPGGSGWSWGGGVK